MILIAPDIQAAINSPMKSAYCPSIVKIIKEITYVSRLLKADKIIMKN